MKVGQIVECDFGTYIAGKNGKPNFDGHIPPEMVKKRLAIILNKKLSSAYIVVPLSSKHDKQKEGWGYHVKIDSALVPQTKFWTPCERWAKGELVEHVSSQRVVTLRDDHGQFITTCLDRPIVEQIQRAIMTAVSGASLLLPK